MASSSDRIARRYFVRGRVQGVYFRAFVQKQATDLGMTGYTRNLDDGRVEVLAMGTHAQHDELSGRLWQGPAMADVRGVEQEEAAPVKTSGFRITG